MSTETPQGAGDLSTEQSGRSKRARMGLGRWMGADALRRRWAPLVGVAVTGLVFATCGGDTPTAPATVPPTPVPSPPALPQPPSPPPAPTGLHVSATTPNSITWTWTAVQGATAYEVQLSANPVFDDTDAIKTTAETSYTATGLSPENGRHLRVRAIAGTVEAPVLSAWSSHVTGMSGMPPPSHGAPLTVTGLSVQPPFFLDAGFQIDDNIHFTIWWSGGNVELQGEATLSIVIGDEVRTLESPNVGNRDEVGWLYFRYVVTADDRDEDGLSVARDALKLAAGSQIVDVATQIPVSIDLEEHALENASAYKVRAQLIDYERVAGLRVAELSRNSVLWVWEPTDSATNYQVRARLRDSGQDAGEAEVSDPSYLWEGLEPGTRVQLRVRAMASAGGPAIGPWSNPVSATTWPESWPTPRECTDERERALSFNMPGYSAGPPVLIDEWDGTPFRFYFTPGYNEDDRRAAQHSMNLVRDFSELLKDQIGYRIIEVGGWIENVEWSLDERDCSWRKPGQITGIMVPGGRGDFVLRCAVYEEGAGALTRGFGTVHELFHLFGFAHSPESHTFIPGVGGISMSPNLTSGSGGFGDTFEDRDALRCIFPEGG